jgi:hypothetical protein
LEHETYEIISQRALKLSGLTELTKFDDEYDDEDIETPSNPFKEKNNS